MLFALARVSGFVRDDCVCGVANTDARRIIKGTVTKPSKYPWMVALYSTHQKAYCGGALISDKHVKRVRWRIWNFTEFSFLRFWRQHIVSRSSWVACLNIQSPSLKIIYDYSPFADDYWLDIYGKLKTHHTDKGDKIRFKKVQIHPNFTSLKTYDDFDLAILTLPKPIAKFQQNLIPICVPKASNDEKSR